MENARNVESLPPENAGMLRVTRRKMQEYRGSPAGKRRNVEGLCRKTQECRGSPTGKCRNVEGHPPENAGM